MSPQQHADKIDQLTQELNAAVLAARNDDLKVDVTAAGHPNWAIVQIDVATRHHPARVLRQLHAKQAEEAHGAASMVTSWNGESPRKG